MFGHDHSDDEDKVSENLTEAQKAHKKEMERFKQRLTKPHISENIYMDMNIENLIMMYERSIKDLEEWNKLFNINEQNRDIILTDPKCAYDQKDKLRQIFEEICYTTQITNEQVFTYFGFLEKRIKDIQVTIDHHFKFIKDIIEKDRR